MRETQGQRHKKSLASVSASVSASHLLPSAFCLAPSGAVHVHAWRLLSLESSKTVSSLRMTGLTSEIQTTNAQLRRCQRCERCLGEHCHLLRRGMLRGVCHLLPLFICSRHCAPSGQRTLAPTPQLRRCQRCESTDMHGNTEPVTTSARSHRGDPARSRTARPTGERPPCRLGPAFLERLGS